MALQAGVNGVLPVTALQKNAPASAPRGPKAPQPRLKLVCRRLPPALTKAEFETILGAEWKLGAGRIDYFNYRKGKVSKDQAKPSRPSCAYVRVTQQSYVVILGDHVRALSFIDAAKSFQDPALIGPPSLEYAPFLKVPGGRKRNDNRQGTIDQDQEFKDFLESLTNPITKPPAPEAEPPKEEKVKTTPLIEALREKKANKEKSQSKSSKSRGEGKDDHGEKKILTKSAKDSALSSGDKNRRISKAEKAQAAKEAVKILNKEAASSKDGATEKTPAPERKRGNVALAKSMLQRDLGVGPTPTRRRGTKREIPSAASDNTAQTENHNMTKQKAKDSTATTTAEKTAVPTPKKERPTRAERRAFKASLADKTNNKDAVDEGKTQTKGATSSAPMILKKPKSTQTPTPTAPKGLAASRVPPTEPAAARNIPAQPQANAAKAETSTPARPASSTSQPASTPSAPAPTSKQAFLKHANASQGITEPLIEEALKIFGTVEKVEIDKRKGFAYVDFTEPEGLQKAIAASPVKVAQGAVQVLERKDKPARNTRFNGPPTGPARGGGRGGFASRGRGRGNARGGGQASTNTNAGDTAPAATPAPAPVPTAADAAT